MNLPENLTKEILAGKIFICPTDTIYGLGCNAESKEAVERIKEIKLRDRDKPLSVIAPSITWIKENLIIDDGLELSRYLPGSYTLILKKKNPNFLSWVSSSDSLGVRIPKNSFTNEIQKAGVVFITTSVNLSGEPFALSLEDIPKELKEKVDYVVEAEKNEKLSGNPSTLIINGKEVKRN
jgi:L-threonylcarbamoyladenylate synthase